MDCEEMRLDIPNLPPEEQAEIRREAKLMFKFNHTEPYTEEYAMLMKELFSNMGEGTHIATPVSGISFDKVTIGRNCFINSNCLMMARGGITLEDNVMIAANVQLISNNHDFYDLPVIVCKPVLIKEDCWIGAGATILPGVCVGKHAVVGAMSVVTKDVPDYAVVTGNPARVVKMLDKDKIVKR